MSYLANKIGILKDVFMGNLMKLKVIYDICLRKAIDIPPQRDTTIIVSLTSYGKRVKIAKMPIAKADKQLAPYIDWPEYCHVPADFEYEKTKIFPLGIGGVLYPSRIFDDEVLNESVFMALCPKADDIWLYIMGLRCQAEKRMLIASQTAYYHTDLLRQYFTKDRLTAQNRLEGENDIQLQALLQHYNISI